MADLTTTSAGLAKKARLTSILRFLLTIGLAIGISAAFNEPKIGGYAALGAFMALLSDTNYTLESRLGGLFVTFLGILCAAGLGILLRDLPNGEWLVLAVVCFGESLLSFAERFWWMWGKYCLVFLMISLFDFAPNLEAVLGYSLGFGLAGVVITIDHFVWRMEDLSKRPMAELTLLENGNRNSFAFAAISALTIVVGLWISKLIDVSEPGWVGITIIYLLNTSIADGLKRIIQRLVGTLAGYFVVLWLFSYAANPWILGALIVFSSLGIPAFVGKDYTAMSFFITVYILFVLDWLLRSYGGDGAILQWRLWDTLLGAACASVGYLAMWVYQHFNPPKTQGS